MAEIAVLGQVGRDLVLRVEALPDAGGSVPVLERRELLGGKGANQAVACRQLGRSVAIVGVVGDDAAGTMVLEQAVADELDVRGVVRRTAARTALLVDLVESGGVRRLLEDVPDEVLLRPTDVARAEGLLRGASVALVQLQQPADAVLAALDLLATTRSMVVADGASDDPRVKDALLRAGAVLRADAHEAELLLGRLLGALDEVEAAADELVAAGARVVALAAGDAGNVVAWQGGRTLVPLSDAEPVDPTGGGDSFVAALTVALLEGSEPEPAARAAAAAAASTVSRLGGRPQLGAGA